MPLPGTRMIPRDWSRKHQAVIVTAMNASIDLLVEDGEATYDEATNVTTQPYRSLLADPPAPARLQSLSGDRGRVYELAGQRVIGVPYLVQLSADVGSAIAPGTRVSIVAVENDPEWVNDDLWVVAPLHGSERFNLDLLCSDNATDAVRGSV